MDGELKAVNNKKRFRFEMLLDNGEYATLQYRWLKGKLVLMSTIVPTDMRKKGIGGILVKQVLEYARSQNLKIIIYCPFVKKFVESHREYNDLLD